MEAMSPKFSDEEAINPFDFWNGANFKVKITKKDGYFNYDSSSFDRPSILASDPVLEQIYSQLHSLKQFVDPSNFKTYEELEARFNQALGKTSTKPRYESFDDDDEETNLPSTTTIDTEVDETLDYFSNLLSD